MKIYSVSEVTREIRSSIEERFPELWVEGEISNFKPAGSGHYYFSLKDENAQIKAVMFRGANRLLRFQIENGLRVLGHGRVSVYEPRGEYQIILEFLEPKGVGDLQLAFEQLKKKLEAEGLFEASRKKPLPLYPRRIAIVTSPTGAVIRDMIHVLTRRFPCAEIVLFPVAVQGAGAAADIANAIAEMNRREGLDILIVGRGGGSIEDLWAFNEEVVARAIAASKIPVISAVGHETDFTIADFVADVRAPTPSAAAEIAVPVLEDLRESLHQSRRRLWQGLEQRIETAALKLKNWKSYFRNPERRVTEAMMTLDHLREKMTSSLEHRLEIQMAAASSLSKRLASVSPLAILDRGYAIVSKSGATAPLKNPAEVSPGEILEIRLARGKLNTSVI